jgi:hypothetical protein
MTTTLSPKVAGYIEGLQQRGILPNDRGEALDRFDQGVGALLNAIEADRAERGFPISHLSVSTSG